MEQEKKSRLMKFTTAAKHIIFDADRMRKFLPLLNTRDGAIKAVQAVMAAIEMKRPIPTDIAPLLGVNIYILMVDMAQEIVGKQPDKKIVAAAMVEIMRTIASSKPTEQTQPPPEQTPDSAAQQQPAGLIGV